MFEGGAINFDHAVPEYVKSSNEKSVIIRGELDGTILYVSPSVESTMGFKPEFLVGKSYYDFIHPDDTLDFYTPFKNGEMEIATFTYRILHADGHFIWMETTATVVKDRQTNKPFEVLSISHDFSEKKKKYTQLNDVDNLSMISRIAAGFAHEISNPITTIKGFLQLMEAEPNVNKDYLLLMQGEIKRIEDITRDFMILGRPPSNNFDKLDIIKILKDVMSILEREAAKYNVRLSLKSSPDLIYFECDETKIKQVLINIIKNGIEAMHSNGGELSVHVSLVKLKNKIVIEISDEGSGISETDLKKIGNPFFTTKAGGNGLGMMMCYRIIEDYNGQINIKSKINEGTTFTIQLPQWRSSTN